MIMDTVGSIIAIIVFVYIAYIFYRIISDSKKIMRGTYNKSGSNSSSSVDHYVRLVKGSGATNNISEKVRREETRLLQDERNHASAVSREKFCRCEYTTDDASFDFNGYDILDDFEELHKRNREHEAHLKNRISNM